MRTSSLRELSDFPKFPGIETCRNSALSDGKGCALNSSVEPFWVRPGEQQGFCWAQCMIHEYDCAVQGWVFFSVSCYPLGTPFGQGDAVIKVERKRNTASRPGLGHRPSVSWKTLNGALPQNEGESGSEWRIIENNDDQGMCLWPLTFPPRGWSKTPWAHLTSRLKEVSGLKGPGWPSAVTMLPPKGKDPIDSAGPELPGSACTILWSYSSYSSFCA